MPAGPDPGRSPALPSGEACHGPAQAAGDSVRLWLRPPAGGDLPQITAMWKRCSLATRIARFHAPVRDIPPSYLKAMLSDPSASLIAVHRHDGAVAALASLIPGTDGTAELGVLAEDSWQRHGIGRQLTARLLGAASARQITDLTASVLAENAAVIGMLRQIPGELSLTRDGTTISVQIRLHPPAQHATAH